ncbi:hypothetical protein Mgra_00008798, partial [Meloidogyne graminicola]
MLIKNFVLNYDENAYNNILAPSGMEISIFRYIKNYNELEKMANNFMGAVANEQLFNYQNIKFKYKNYIFVLPKIIMTVNEAEKRGGIFIFPALFDDNYNKIYNMNYLSIVYLQYAINIEFTNEECFYIMKNILKNLKELNNDGTEQIKLKINNLIVKYLIEKGQKELLFVKDLNQKVHNKILNKMYEKCKYVANLYQGEGSSNGQRGEQVVEQQG